MPSKDEALSEAQKLTALHQIQCALCYQKNPTLRACGLTEGVALAVAEEGLVQLYRVEDEGPVLDIHVVDRISECGLGILARGEVAEMPPLRVALEPRHESVGSRIFRATRSGLWDLIKIAVGVLLGALITWYLKKYFP
jgi:hypothetical protein